MELVLQFLQENLPFIFAHKYWFLFLGAAIEGLNTMVLGGFLVSINSINLGPAFLLFLSGYTLNGYLWYLVGYFAGSAPIDRWGRRDPKSKKIIERVEQYFEKYSGKAIIITKFTFSLTIATLIIAGSLKYSFRKFSVYNFIGSLLWVILTMSIGYFFGQSYRFFFDYLKNLTFFIIFFGAAVYLVYIFRKAAFSAFIRSLLAHEKLRFLGDRIKGVVDRILSDKEDK